MATIAILWPKIASATLARALRIVIICQFYPILTNEYSKMTSSSRRIECNKKKAKFYLLALNFGFWAPLLLRGLTWAMMYIWTQNYPQIFGTCPGHHSRLTSKNRAPPPPPLKFIFTPLAWNDARNFSTNLENSQSTTRVNISVPSAGCSIVTYYEYPISEKYGELIIYIIMI